MLNLKLSHVFTGSPTTDCNKIPDLIDFCVIKGIPDHQISAKSSLDLSSDHTTVIVIERSEFLHTLPQNIPLKSEIDIENAIHTFNKKIQQAAWSSTPVYIKSTEKRRQSKAYEMIKAKRQLRKSWQQTRDSQLKTALNKANKEVKKKLQHIESCLIIICKIWPQPKPRSIHSGRLQKQLHKQTSANSAIKQPNVLKVMQILLRHLQCIRQWCLHLFQGVSRCLLQKRMLSQIQSFYQKQRFKNVKLVAFSRSSKQTSHLVWKNLAATA